MRGMSIRWKLTLWYGLVLAIVLVVFGGAVYVAMRRMNSWPVLTWRLGGELDEIAEDVQAVKDRTRLSEQLKRRFARHEIYEFQVSRVSGEPFFQSDRLKPSRFPVPPVPGSLKHLDFESVAARHGKRRAGFARPFASHERACLRSGRPGRGPGGDLARLDRSGTCPTLDRSPHLRSPGPCLCPRRRVLTCCKGTNTRRPHGPYGRPDHWHAIGPADRRPQCR